nr:phage holin family protein [Enterococcus gilvus]
MNGVSVESIVYGAVSGLASTGLHQVFTKLLNLGGND